MIDLTGLELQHDAIIKVSSVATYKIEVAFMWQHDDAIAALKAIENRPMLKVLGGVIEPVFDVYLQAIDVYQLAERIAISLEENYNLRVQRLVTDPDDPIQNKSAKKPIQSFLLV